MTIDEIWKIDDVNGFIVALSDYIERKCAFGDNMTALNANERTFFITQICEVEVNNGGFAQFFENFSGNFARELVSAFRQIGALKTAEICRRAINAFGCELPSDMDERREQLDSLSSDNSDSILSECDKDFYKYEDDLNALNYAFVSNHRADFT